MFRAHHHHYVMVVVVHVFSSLFLNPKQCYSHYLHFSFPRSFRTSYTHLSANYILKHKSCRATHNQENRKTARTDSTTSGILEFRKIRPQKRRTQVNSRGSVVIKMSWNAFKMTQHTQDYSVTKTIHPLFLVLIPTSPGITSTQFCHYWRCVCE